MRQILCWYDMHKSAGMPYTGTIVNADTRHFAKGTYAEIVDQLMSVPVEGVSGHASMVHAYRRARPIRSTDTYDLRHIESTGWNVPHIHPVRVVVVAARTESRYIRWLALGVDGDSHCPGLGASPTQAVFAMFGACYFPWHHLSNTDKAERQKMFASAIPLPGYKDPVLMHKGWLDGAEALTSVYADIRVL